MCITSVRAINADIILFNSKLDEFNPSNSINNRIINFKPIKRC